MVGKAGWQEGQAPGYIVSTIRKRRDECWYPACFLLGPFLFQLGHSPQVVLPTFKMLLPSSVKHLETASRTHSQVCLLGGSNPSGANNGDWSSWMTIHFLASHLTKNWSSVLLMTSLVLPHLSGKCSLSPALPSLFSTWPARQTTTWLTISSAQSS